MDLNKAELILGLKGNYTIEDVKKNFRVMISGNSKAAIVKSHCKNESAILVGKFKAKLR